MSLFSQFATDRKAEAEGIWIQTDATTQFRIARRGRSNKRFRAMIDAETKPHEAQIRTGSLDPDVDAQISLKVFAHTLLLDWRGVKDEQHRIFSAEDHDGPDGTVKYTPERGIALLTALPDLYDLLSENAGKATNFREVQIENDGKN